MKRFLSIVLAFALSFINVPHVFALDAFADMKFLGTVLDKGNVYYKIGDSSEVQLKDTDIDPGGNIWVKDIPVDTKVSIRVESDSYEVDDIYALEGDSDSRAPNSTYENNTYTFTTKELTYPIQITFKDESNNHQNVSTGDTKVNVTVSSNESEYLFAMTQEKHFDGHKIELYEDGSSSDKFDSKKSMRFKIDLGMWQVGKIHKVVVNGETKIDNGTSSYVEFEADFVENYNIQITFKDVYTTHSIMWANPGAIFFEQDDFNDPGVKLVHGQADVKAILDPDGNDVTSLFYKGLDRGRGYVVVPESYRVIFKFVPERGYQLKTVEANGNILEAKDNVNEYTFIMPDAHIHFTAHFEKVDDSVDVQSTSIKQGSSIQVADNIIDSGTAKLDIKDASINNESKERFDQEASKNEFEVKEVLDLKLNQIFHKANTQNDVWVEEIKDLNGEKVKITLNLANTIQGEQYSIIHETHDASGTITGYEQLETQYDPTNHTLTFETDSFSNFAIATKGTPKKKRTVYFCAPALEEGFVEVVNGARVFDVNGKKVTLKIKYNNSYPHLGDDIACTVSDNECFDNIEFELEGFDEETMIFALSSFTIDFYKTPQVINGVATLEGIDQELIDGTYVFYYIGEKQVEHPTLDATVEASIEEIVRNIELTPEIQEAIDNNRLELNLLVLVQDENDLPEDFIVDLQNEIKNTLSSNAKVAMYLDITLGLRFFDSNGNEIDYQEVSNPGKVKVRFACPEELIKEGRKYYVVKMHSPSDIKTIEATLVDGYLEFETDQFSSYVLVYEDQQVQTPTTSTVKTGDETYMIVYALAMCISLLVLISTIKNNHI